MSVTIDEWLSAIKQDYLDDYINQGGSAVKFVVCDEVDSRAARDQLAALAQEKGMRSLFVDSVQTRLHMLQDVLFAVAPVVDISELAQAYAEAMVRALSWQWPQAVQRTSFEEIGRVNQIDPALVKLEVQKYLTRDLMSDRRLAQDFRVAAMRLVYSRFQTSGSREVDEERILRDWLGGTLEGRSGLASLGIAGRIGRHNARAILRSLVHWHRRVRGCGLLLWLDLAGLDASGGRRRYSPVAALDLFEVLRQLIDGIDTLDGLLCVVAARPSFLDESDHRYSLHAYLALKMRLWSDVRPRGRDNPLAPLVELRPAQEEVVDQ